LPYFRKGCGKGVEIKNESKSNFFSLSIQTANKYERVEEQKSTVESYFIVSQEITRMLLSLIKL